MIAVFENYFKIIVKKELVYLYKLIIFNKLKVQIPQ